MSDALFDLGRNDSPAHRSDISHSPVREEQIDAIREAFKSAGIDNQEERQRIVQAASVRQIGSLRELYAHEAHRVLQRMQQRVQSRPDTQGASAWDLREEDTWIDRL